MLSPPPPPKNYCLCFCSLSFSLPLILTLLASNIYFLIFLLATPLLKISRCDSKFVSFVFYLSL